jgi:hypothetical protein
MNATEGEAVQCIVKRDRLKAISHHAQGRGQDCYFRRFELRVLFGSNFTTLLFRQM